MLALRWRSASLALSFAVFLVASQCWTQEPSAVSSEYDHLLFHVASSDRGRLLDSLVLQKLPPGNATRDDWESLRRTVPVRAALGQDAKPLGVYGGHLVVILRGHLEAIDLETGQRRSLMKFVDQGILHRNRVFAVRPRGSGLWEINLDTLEKTAHISQSPHVFARAAYAVSIDGSHLALTVSDPNVQHFQIVTVDRQPEGNVVQKHSHEFVGRMLITGGGDHFEAPRVAWWDSETLLIVEHDPGPDIHVVVGGQPTRPSRLQAMKTKSGEVDFVCTLPQAEFQWAFDPHFWRRPDGELLLNIATLGDFRIDLERKQLLETNQLTTDFSLRGDVAEPFLFYKDQPIGAQTSRNRISISPDGRRVAWLPPRVVRQGFVKNDPVALSVHPAELGQREVMTGHFTDSSLSYEPSTPFPSSRILWVSSDQLQKARAFEQAELVTK